MKLKWTLQKPNYTGDEMSHGAGIIATDKKGICMAYIPLAAYPSERILKNAELAVKLLNKKS